MQQSLVGVGFISKTVSHQNVLSQWFSSIKSQYKQSVKNGGIFILGLNLPASEGQNATLQKYYISITHKDIIWVKSHLWLARTRPSSTVQCHFWSLLCVILTRAYVSISRIKRKTGWVSLSATFPLTFHISDLYSDPSKPRHLSPSCRWPRSCQHLWRYFIRSCCPCCMLPCSTRHTHSLFRLYDL